MTVWLQGMMICHNIFYSVALHAISCVCLYLFCRTPPPQCGYNYYAQNETKVCTYDVSFNDFFTLAHVGNVSRALRWVL